MSRSIDAAFDSLLLQTAKERFRYGVVPAIAPPTHAGYQVVVFAPTVEVVAAELAALVGVNHHGGLGPSAVTADRKLTV